MIIAIKTKRKKIARLSIILICFNSLISLYTILSHFDPQSHNLSVVLANAATKIRFFRFCDIITWVVKNNQIKI